MQFSEVLLRLGSALVSWMIIYAYFVWLLTLQALGCGPDVLEMFRLLLLMAPITLVAALLLGVTRAMAEVHQVLRWLGIPIVILMPFALFMIWGPLTDVTISGGSICARGAPATWQRIWPPAQLLTVSACAWAIARDWR